MTLLELLTSGRIDEFNGKRGQRVTLDFFAVDLSGMKLAGADLSGANLEKADLTDADLTGAVLAKANLSGADLTGATLDRCVGIRARMRGAYLGSAKAADAEFSGADLSEADLTGFVATNARFAGARLKEAVLVDAVLTGCDLAEARLGGADLRGADLSGTKLGGADLVRVNATGTRFVGADLKGARMSGATLRGAVLTRADLSGADLSTADLTGADLTEANFERADLFDVQSDPGALDGARLPAGFADASVLSASDVDLELHFEDPSVAASGGAVAVLWDNADGEDTFTLRLAVSTSDDPFTEGSTALAFNVDEVLARAVLPHPKGFSCALFLDRPAGVDLVVLPVDRTGAIGAQASARLGYVPVVKPVIVPDDDGFLVFGIGRQGALSAHRFDGEALVELMRAPAGTYRGFCGRLDPILLGKGGTVAPVRRDGIGRLESAPSGYPGRLTAAAWRAEPESVALAWVGKGEKGARVQVLGTPEATRLDVQHEIGALDLRDVKGRWLLVYTRESATDADVTAPYAVWLPGGKPFPLLSGDDLVDIEDVRFVPGPRPLVALVTLGEDLVVVDVGDSAATVVARFGSSGIG